MSDGYSDTWLPSLAVDCTCSALNLKSKDSYCWRTAACGEVPPCTLGETSTWVGENC